MAATADRHKLYEDSVQDPQREIEFLQRLYRKLTGRRPMVLREDFCGTAQVCCQWVKMHQQHIAIGIDLDPRVLRWASRRNVAQLSREQTARLKLLNNNVLTVQTASADVIAAMNFSYYTFKTRHQLLQYFRHCRSGLSKNGVMFLDAFGGYDAYREMEETTKHGKFTYVWDQAKYDPVTGDMTCYIHFTFPDGSALRRAFRYEWRLWSLPEIKELLVEAGFSKILVYWEGTDVKSGEGNGIFRPVKRGDADAGWIAYLIAQK